MPFQALLTEKSEAGAITSSVQTLDNSRLPDGNVTLTVEWSGLNYKDGLALTGGGGIVRTYPHIGGIDASGTVLDSADPRYAPGDQVILTGWRVGETHWGGYAQKLRLDANWLVPLPKGMSTRTAMMLGTAGFTAMRAIDRLEANGLTPSGGEVLVTGAGGGTGSIAVHLLGKLGYQVVAVSGRPQLAEGLRQLGATSIIARDELMATPDKPLESARWAGVVDTVGGAMLGKVLKQVKAQGAVAAFGNAGGIELNTTVLPFILRGVALLGIDSVMQSYSARIPAWTRLAELFDPVAFEPFVSEVGLAELPQAARDILAGKVQGRTLVKLR
ncbi:MAG: acryloyl-CoA reductase [Devosia sp.]|uniref:acrylyl-CoA reductase family protein n=1 Tax=Devosia sp. TaxID=1871048 RepID=UPI00260814E9|nr:acryloyl-CoA reductase [Devosia sp.]MDB5529617.1 acryloyl-CoA reductase [Devosia sp.]